MGRNTTPAVAPGCFKSSPECSLYFAGTIQVSCGGCCQQLGDADQIVGCHGECEQRFDLGASSQFGLGEASLGLDPAEHLLDPLAADLARPIARMSGGASINGGFAHDAQL